MSQHVTFPRRLTRSSTIRSGSVYTGQIELGPNLLERQRLHYCSLWRARVDLEPERRVPPGPGLCILQVALQPFTLPVWSAFHGRSWVASEPGPQPSVLTSLAVAVKGACVLAKTGRMSGRVLGVSCPAPRRGGTPASLATTFSTSLTPSSGSCLPGTPQWESTPKCHTAISKTKWTPSREAVSLPSPKGATHTAGWRGGKEKIYPLRSWGDFRAGAFGHQSHTIVVFDEEKGLPGPDWQGLN